MAQTEATPPTAQPSPAEQLPIPLDRDVFMRSLIRELAGTLQDVVGLDEAAGFISVVAQNMGRQINNDYRIAWNTGRLNPDQVGQVLVDLKRRIHGDFHIESQDASKIVLYNYACPFADKVKERPAMCMMTSNVFGTIAADNLGYAKVDLQETIAEGSHRCRVVVHLELTPEAQAAGGREYFQSSDA